MDSPSNYLWTPSPPNLLIWFALQCSKSKQCTKIHSCDHMPGSRGYMRAQYPLLMALPVTAAVRIHSTQHSTTVSPVLQLRQWRPLDASRVQRGSQRSHTTLHGNRAAQVEGLYPYPYPCPHSTVECRPAVARDPHKSPALNTSPHLMLSFLFTAPSPGHIRPEGRIRREGTTASGMTHRRRDRPALERRGPASKCTIENQQ